MADPTRAADDPSPDAVPLGYRVIGVVVGALVAAMRWQVRVEGTEHVPATGGAVLTWNHTGNVDFVLTALHVLRRTGRWVRFLAMRQLWESPTLGWVPRLARCVPVERESRAGRHDALRAAAAAAGAGHIVMVAPEGTISESFELLPFRTGAARIAQAAGVPIVPTVSWGTHRFVTTGRPASLRRGWRLPVVIRVGEPIRVAPDEDPVAATRRLEAVVAGLLAQVRREYPDGAPADAWWVPAADGGGAPPAAAVLARHRPGQALSPGRHQRHRRRPRGRRG